MTLDEIAEIAARGDHAAAATQLEAELAGNLSDAERAIMLGHLAAEYRCLQRLGAALETARQADSVASRAADPNAKAYAGFALGTALVAIFDRDEGPEDLPVEALQVLDRAAHLYQQLDHIDLSSVLLTMGTLSRMVGDEDAARQFYARVTRELVDPRWSEDEATARRADHLRGRAFLGLGRAALALERRDEAAEMFEAAASLLIASGDRASIPLLEELADAFESVLGDASAAETIREAAAALTQPAR